MFIWRRKTRILNADEGFFAPSSMSRLSDMEKQSRREGEKVDEASCEKRVWDGEVNGEGEGTQLLVGVAAAVLRRVEG